MQSKIYAQLLIFIGTCIFSAELDAQVKKKTPQGNVQEVKKKEQLSSEMEEVYKTLFCGVKVNSSAINAIALLNQSGYVEDLGTGPDGHFSGYFIKHDIINIEQLKGPYGHGTAETRLFITNGKITQRRIIVNHQMNFRVYNILKALVEGVASYTSVKEQNRMGDIEREIFFLTETRKTFAVLSSRYNPLYYNPEKGGDDRTESIWYMITLLDTID